MAKSDFENLKAYNLSEALADEIWDVVLGWDRFARDTVGGQIGGRLTALERTSRRARDEAAFKTIEGSSGWREDRLRKHNISFGGLTGESF